VPDFYQGTDLWDFSLVDPDNRRPVDFAKRVALLEELQRLEAKGVVSLVRELVEQPQDGRIKLYVIYKALNCRRAQRDLFTQGAYLPLTTSGARQDHVVAFARRVDQHWAVVAVPRLVTKLVPSAKPLERLRVGIDRFPRLVMKLSPSSKPPMGKRLWKESLLQLPDGAPQHWHNVFTGEELMVSDHNPASRSLFVHEVFRRFPVALLLGSTTA
jgi:(1->4)-alpha-D-glucan 1-alpha-D-glucosylmutase